MHPPCDSSIRGEWRGIRTMSRNSTPDGEDDWIVTEPASNVLQPLAGLQTDWRRRSSRFERLARIDGAPLYVGPGGVP